MHVNNTAFPESHSGGGNRDQKNERVNLVMTGDQTEGRFAVVETVVKRTEEPPLHSHTREDELIHVVQGNVIFHLDGNRLECPAGNSVFLPKGSEHTYCIESEEARLLTLLVPAGLEGFYRELDVSVDAEHFIERLITVSARYGVKIMGPGPLEDPAHRREPTCPGEGTDPVVQM